LVCSQCTSHWLQAALISQNCTRIIRFHRIARRNFDRFFAAFIEVFLRSPRQSARCGSTVSANVEFWQPPVTDATILPQMDRFA
jgi:hypothetical protein